ncbi:hypothetical protein Q5P01_017053 [Channa striata]|uniref:Outer dynein arm-docking complex subunit 4 n=1 Tax=Channa striata TaxID=64152 RepID=A0AA88SB23_CHASR|nr:hypothetical protein Q5P01_017053 [Channa striata]
MSDKGGDQDDQRPKGVFSTLMADGDWLYHKGEFKKAIDSFTMALALKPDDRYCFVGRSKCFLKMGEPENALRDAETSLKGDKSFFEGLYQKAEALYYIGEFEFALVFYHRGQKLALRPQVEDFRLGIQKAQEAIENSIGSPTSVKLEIKGDLSFLQKDQPITAIQHSTKKKKQQTPKMPNSERTTKHLLGEFYSDKKYLENLLNDEDLAKSKTKEGERLQDIIQNCLTYLDTCTEFWSEEKPGCAQEKDRKHVQPKTKKPLHYAASEPALFLRKSLEDIDAKLTSGNADGSLKKAKEVMKIVQGWPENKVPNKKEVLGSLHSVIGDILFNLGDMAKALEHHHKDLELAKKCKFPDAMSRALDNIGRVNAQMGQFTQAIEFWEKKIPLIRGGLEKTWLFHELGRCYLELNRCEKARDYGIRSVAAAEEIADEKWQINGNVLVAQSELKLGKLESCVAHFERALTHAKLQEDISAMNAIQKALDEAKQQRGNAWPGGVTQSFIAALLVHGGVQNQTKPDMDTEKSDTVLDASEASPQEETAMEKEVVSKLETPQAADEEPKQLAVNGHDKEASNTKTTEEVIETENVVLTEKKTDTEDSSGKDKSETETVLGAVAPPPEPDESYGKISHPDSALDTEPKNIQPEQQPVSKNDPEPLPMKTPLAESTSEPEPEPEKGAESVLQEETLAEPAKPLQPVNTQPPSQEEKVSGQVETQAALQATMDKGAGEVAKEGETQNADTTESVKKDGEEKTAEGQKAAATVTSKEDEGVKSDDEPKEDAAPLLGSLSFSILEQKQTKEALLTSRTLIILRGLPGSGKSFLARAINDTYKDHCTVISADEHGVKPENPSAEGYKALDEAVVACCSTGAASSVLIVVDDTNHTQDRLARLEEIAEEHNLVALFLEPQTDWSRDPAQLSKKTKRGLDEAQLKTMKGPLEEVSLPLFYGWFLLSSVQEKVGCTSMDFLKTLDTLEAFKKHMADFTGKADKEVDLEQYFEAKGNLHCTTKFCNYGKAEGAKEYAEKPGVKKFYGSIFELSLTALFVTPRTVGARVSLTEEQLQLWPADAEKEAESVVPTAASLPLGSRAHITLGCAEGVEPVQTGLDLLQILALQQEGQEGELVTEMELGSLRYYGEGRWLLSLREPMCAQACFSSYYNRKEVEPTKKEAEKKKKPKCTILNRAWCGTSQSEAEKYQLSLSADGHRPQNSQEASFFGISGGTDGESGASGPRTHHTNIQPVQLLEKEKSHPTVNNKVSLD